MSFLKNIFLYGILLLLIHVARADVMVKLNINRPINDISDRFVSFSIKQEDLYQALDSPNRDTVTYMASMLSQSYVKFVGDYYFAEKMSLPLRNPTKTVWKGFNKWTKAVKWFMIIPVPYQPDNWNPMETLKILNTSKMVDINEAIWQLGKDFGTTRASDYIKELNTFNIMVDSFKQTFTNWQTMGADISSGSSPEETIRYVNMSRDLNAAYGWIQSEDMFSGSRVGLSVDGQDPALKVLLNSKVPVWLSLPKKKNLLMYDEVLDGLNWAETMGEAANVGFKTIFKPLTLKDIEKPNYNFYVTTLFKKIMGSRVYPARPLNLFGFSNKLYTHCSNMVSGGLAFMVVNRQYKPLEISLRSMHKLQDTEVWQYTLSMENNQILLNNKKLFLNSTLMPYVRRRNNKVKLQLDTPGSSVSFWVLPNANLEHCHFIEVEAPIQTDDNDIIKIKRYSSSDRLLSELIKESTKSAFSPLFSSLKRNRRSVVKDNRFKPFILKETKDHVQPLVNFIQDMTLKPKGNTNLNAMEWIKNIFNERLPLLKRNARHSGPQICPCCMTRDCKTKKPEEQVKRLLVDHDFDEEKFFKNVKSQDDTEQVRFPEECLCLSNKDSVDSEGLDEELKFITKNGNRDKIPKNDIVGKIKCLSSSPAEFPKTFSTKLVSPSSTNINNVFNSNTLQLSDWFGKHQHPETNDDDDDIMGKVFNKAESSDQHEESICKNIGDVVDAREKALCTSLSSLDNLRFSDSNDSESDKNSDTATTLKSEKIPCFKCLSKRLKRSLDSHYSENSLSDNMISKKSLSSRLPQFKQKVDDVIQTTESKSHDVDDNFIGEKIVNSFRNEFTKLLDIFSQHAKEFYNNFKYEWGSGPEETATE